MAPSNTSLPSLMIASAASHGIAVSLLSALDEITRCVARPWRSKMMSFTAPTGLPSPETTGMPMSVEARRSTGIDASGLGSGSAAACEADACDAADESGFGAVDAVAVDAVAVDAVAVDAGDAGACEADAGGVVACGAATVSGTLGIAAAAAVSCAVGCADAGASVGAKGATDWLQEAAANPRAAKMSGRKILIMGAL